MLSWLTDFWIVKLILGSGAVVIAGCLIAMMWFGKPALDIIAGFLKPIMAKLGEVIADLLEGIKEALKVGVPDILDDWKTIVTVGLIVFGSLTAYQAFQPPAKQPTAFSCKPVVDALRKDFRFVPRR